LDQKNLAEIYNFEQLEEKEETKKEDSLVIHPFLKQMLESDAYNTYCVDCKLNISECCSLTFGIFICYKCAIDHQNLLGPGISFIKTLVSSEWDEY